MVKLYNDGKRITAALSGDIDHHAAREMRRELDEVIERSQPELLIIDMENVGFMDSSGIGLITRRYRQLHDRGGSVGVINVNARMDRILLMSGIYRIATRLDSGARDEAEDWTDKI